MVAEGFFIGEKDADAEIHTYAYIDAYIHAYIHANIHTYIRTYIHRYICTYVHTYIHTYMFVVYNMWCMVYIVVSIWYDLAVQGPNMAVSTN